MARYESVKGTITLRGGSRRAIAYRDPAKAYVPSGVTYQAAGHANRWHQATAQAAATFRLDSEEAARLYAQAETDATATFKCHRPGCVITDPHVCPVDDPAESTPRTPPRYYPPVGFYRSGVASECTCVVSCADDPRSACSLSGRPHVHPDDGRGIFGPCPEHPDVEGDL